MVNFKEVSKSWKIYPRTKTLQAWEIANIKRSWIDHQLVIAADGIRYALSTGRLSGSVDMKLRRMSAYQSLKVLVNVANSCSVMAEVPAFLNRGVK